MMPELKHWLSQAACAGYSSVFFEYSEDAHAKAKAICARCPVKTNCLALVLSLPLALQEHGVWAGLLPHELREYKIKLASQQRAANRNRVYGMAQ